MSPANRRLAMRFFTPLFKNSGVPAADRRLALRIYLPFSKSANAHSQRELGSMKLDSNDSK